MDEDKFEKQMKMSREVIMLTLRSEMLAFYKKIDVLPKEEKKCKDLDEYLLLIMFELVEKYLDKGYMVTHKDSFELIMEVIEHYQSDEIIEYSPNYDYDDVYKTLDRWSKYLNAYKDVFYSDGKHSDITIIENEKVSIVDRESGEVEFSFDANTGNILDNTQWKILPEDTRRFLADYIVLGFLAQELLIHQLDLRKMDAKYITLDDFVDEYRKMKKAVDSGE